VSGEDVGVVGEAVVREGAGPTGREERGGYSDRNQLIAGFDKGSLNA